MPEITASGEPWPRVSVVTPSFNQGSYLEATIRSILLQGYPNLEYLVMDGGSTDGSVEIIEKYSPWISYWVSKPDGGQSEAIHRGIERASGIIATWINSDDMLCRDAIGQHVTQNGWPDNTVFAGKCLYVDASGDILRSHQGRVRSLEDLVRLKTFWYGGGHIVQPEVLFPRAMYFAVGGLDCDNHLVMDFDLWGKFFLAGARFHYTNIDFAMFRLQPKQKTVDHLACAQALAESARKFACLSGVFAEDRRRAILAEIDAFVAAYPGEHWRATGRLAMVGLPPQIVTPLRSLRTAFYNKARTLFGKTLSNRKPS